MRRIPFLIESGCACVYRREGLTLRYVFAMIRPPMRNVGYLSTMKTATQDRSKRGRPDGSLPADYRALLTEVKARIRASQIRASLSVNRELIQLYWDIGQLIVYRQKTQGWGAGVIDRLASDLHKTFPGLEGFSASNISRMRAFFLAYAPKYDNSAQAVPISAAESPPPAMACIPWGHNIALLFKLSSPAARIWYAEQVTAKGWSRSMLEHWIESDLYSRQGKAVTNFEAALSRPQSDLANEIVRDPYNFDFLTAPCGQIRLAAARGHRAKSMKA